MASWVQHTPLQGILKEDLCPDHFARQFASRRALIALDFNEVEKSDKGMIYIAARNAHHLTAPIFVETSLRAVIDDREPPKQ